MRLTLPVIFLILIVALSGCGGGGSGATGSAPVTGTLSGVAATGAPIVGGTINVICAQGSAIAPATTDSNGAWSVNLSGQSLPGAVQLAGGTINGVNNNTSYHSIAVTTGTVNVTPLTDLLVANLAATPPVSWFAAARSTPGLLSAITQTQLNTALANLRAALPALTPLVTVNPITTAFTPVSGDVMDDMLTALAQTIANNKVGVSYALLLSNLSVSTTPGTGFAAALTTAYAGTSSGGGSGAPSYTIGGTVSGLTGSLELQDNNVDNLSVSTNGNFVFATPVINAGSYNVTVVTQPVGQTCSASTNAGTVSGSNVSNVVVTCSTNVYTVGGSATGLTGALILQDNNGDNLTVTTSGSFTFASRVANGSPYNVSVLSSPGGQSCSVANNSGTIALANVTNVTVSCATNTYTIGGSVSGLTGSMVLQDNSTDRLTVSGNGSFTFSATVASGNPYSVAVKTQPSGQNCIVMSGSGTATANVSNVSVVCTNLLSALTLSLPARAITPADLAVIVAANDPLSPSIASYYQTVRGIPVANIIRVNLPAVGSDTISNADFATLKAAIDAQLPSGIQATLLTWTQPSRVVGAGTCTMSITSAMAFGFNSSYCANSCAATTASSYYNSESASPLTSYGMRPSMLLGATSLSAAQVLINLGVSADATYPPGDGYLMRTSDAARSVRYSDYLNLPALWTSNPGITLNYIDNSAGAASDSISNKSGVLFYFTGLTTVPNIVTNSYRPGAIADSLTSSGGYLPGGNGQMPITNWLAAGVTGSYGAVAEPCNYTQKFSQASVLIDQYYRGATLIEAYWKSVQWPGQGLFVGEPLAQPYRDTPSFTISGNQYVINTRAMRANSNYSLQYLFPASANWQTLAKFTVTRTQPQILYAPLPPANATQIRWVGPCPANAAQQCTLSASP